MTGVYFHIPFCQSKCDYCAFSSRPLRDRAELEGYVNALKAELILHADRLAGLPIETIYFGGGTPSLLDPATVGDLIALLVRSGASWDDSCEVTLEANPDTLDVKNLAGFRQAGVNRLSLGVQSFFSPSLLFLGRRHAPRQAARAVTLARRAGFDNLSLDLIAGLPDPNRERYKQDLDRALEIRPEHLSVYLLTADKPARLHEQVNQGRVRLPSDDQQADIFLAIHDRLAVRANYHHYEVSNFALPGFASRHNRAYWTATPYIGVGAGAHSHYQQGTAWVRTANVADPDAYRRRLERNLDPVEQMEVLTEPVRLRENLMLALRTDQGVDPSAFGAYAPLIRWQLDNLCDNGWYTRDGERFLVTPAGFLVADGVTSDLWEKMDRLDLKDGTTT